MRENCINVGLVILSGNFTNESVHTLGSRSSASLSQSIFSREIMSMSDEENLS